MIASSDAHTPITPNPSRGKSNGDLITVKLLAAFSFGDIGAKEKAIKKKNAAKRISRSAEREEVQNEQARFAPFTAQAFEKA